jgi:hypothetical protein
MHELNLALLQRMDLENKENQIVEDSALVPYSVFLVIFPAVF